MSVRVRFARLRCCGAVQRDHFIRVRSQIQAARRAAEVEAGLDKGVLRSAATDVTTRVADGRRIYARLLHDHLGIGLPTIARTLNHPVGDVTAFLASADDVRVVNARFRLIVALARNRPATL